MPLQPLMGARAFANWGVDFTRYGLPIEIVSDRGTHFINEVIGFLQEEFMVIQDNLAPYHPHVVKLRAPIGSLNWS